MELVTKKTNSTHKILVMSISGEDKGKSKSITISAPEYTKTQILEIIKEKITGGVKNE